MKSTTMYTPLQRTLHWLMAVLILGMLCVGFYIHGLDPENAAEAPIKSSLGALHKATGMVVLLLAFIRFGVLHRSGKPALPDGTPDWQRKAAKLSHVLLYLLMFAMPLSGYVMSSYAHRPINMYGLFELPMLPFEKNIDMAKAVFEAHEILAWTLVVLIAIHLGGALRHHFIQKDIVLRRMLLGRTD